MLQFHQSPGTGSRHTRCPVWQPAQGERCDGGDSTSATLCRAPVSLKQPWACGAPPGGRRLPSAAVRLCAALSCAQMCCASLPPWSGAHATRTDAPPAAAAAAACRLPRRVRRAGLALCQQGEEATQGVWRSGVPSTAVEERQLALARCGSGSEHPGCLCCCLLCTQTMKFPPEFSTKVDLTKVGMQTHARKLGV